MRKDRPILFCSDMIRVILADTKTQTRRIIKPQPESILHGIPYLNGPKRVANQAITCPYGISGDLLWVRETFWQGIYTYMVPQEDYHETDKLRAIEGYCATDTRPVVNCCKMPSIFMPRWASRITLEVLEVGAERLQDITEADALWEGIGEENVIVGATGAGGSHREIMGIRYDAGSGEWEHEEAIDAFEELWDSINAVPKPAKRNPYTGQPELCKVAYPWENVHKITLIGGKKSSKFYGCKIYTIGNPFVFVVKFKRLEKSDE